MGLKNAAALSHQNGHHKTSDEQQANRPTSKIMSALRYPSLALIYGLLRPAMWVADETDYLPRILETISDKFNIDQINANSFSGYDPSSQDIMVCTYPKSGTNWMLQIAYQITHLGQGEFAHIHDVVAWPDQFADGYAVDLYDKAPIRTSPVNRKVIKTHLPWENIAYSPEARYILLVRDPKDVFVSSYFFSESLMFGPLMPSVEVWLDFFLSEHFLMGSWAANLASYWQALRHENVLFLTYESMIANLPKVIQQVTNFVDIPLSQYELSLVYQKSSFPYMNANNHKFYPGMIVPWANPQGRMIRKGMRGASSEILSLEQQRRIDHYCKQALKDLNCDFPYDDEFDVA